MRLLVTASCVATAAVAASVVMCPAAALAATGTPAAGPGLAALKAKAVGAIDLRLVTLARDDKGIAKATHLTTSDRISLEGVITSDETGLAALRTTITTDATRVRTHLDYTTIFTGYRVFLLLQPQIHDVIAADAITAQADKITANAAALLTKLSTPGPITSDESTDIAAATGDAANAAAAVNAEVAAVVSLIPAEVTKTLRPGELTAAKADNVAARTQLASARAALKAARAAAGAS